MLPREGVPSHTGKVVSSAVGTAGWIASKEREDHNHEILEVPSSFETQRCTAAPLSARPPGAVTSSDPRQLVSASHVEKRRCR